MKHGDEIQILVDGPAIGLKSLEPIGISDGSQCWGVWIDHRYREGIENEEPGFATQARDFVISPIHPSLWPFAFRVEVALNFQPGTLKSLCTQLNQNGVDILYLDQSPGGYTHSIFNAICTFDYPSDHALFKPLEEMEEKLRRLWHGYKRDDEPFQRQLSKIRTEHFKALGLQMVAHLIGLWGCLRIVEQEQYEHQCGKKAKAELKYGGSDRYFLASRVVEQGLEPWFLQLLDPDGSLLRVEGSVDNEAAAQLSFIEAKKRAEEANISILALLASRFPTGIANLQNKSLDELFRLLQHDHKITRCQPGDSGELTVQAVLAHMEEVPWKRHMLRRLLWRHVHLPLAVYALVRLAEMRFWMEPHDPIEFHYDADSLLLRPTDRDRFTSQMKDLGFCGELTRDKPAWALATFNHEDRFVRLRMLPSKNKQLRLRIEVTYEAARIPTPDSYFSGYRHQPAATRGLIAKIAEVILEAQGNVMRVTNGIESFDPNTGVEKGRIRLAVEFGTETMSDNDKQQLLERIETATKTAVKPLTPGGFSVSAVGFERERIFISTIAEHGRYSDFARILKEVAADYGLQTVYAESYVKGVGQNVHEKISTCKYFLQVIAARKDDLTRMSTDPNHIPDFTWVTYEYGCAAALREIQKGRQCVQMIDQLLSQLSHARLDRTRRDVAPIRFRLDDDEQTLRRHFKKAIEQLIHQE